MSKLPLGQLFIFGFDGLEPNSDVKYLLKKSQSSGVILFNRNVETLAQVVELNRELVDMASREFPPFISVDQEGGRVARLRGVCTDVPPMKALGQLAKTDPDIIYRTGAMMARELGAIGFNLDFAPVMDVDTNPENPVIGDRSFSECAEDVAQWGAEFIRGLQGAGIAACAKHFPGHGDTILDSHLDLPVLEHDLERLNKIELLPFVAAKDAEVASVMTAHVLFPKLDPTYPATLSPVILQKLLRDQIGFAGVVISDDLEMKAVADRYTIKELVKLGLLAGVDLFLICKDLVKAEAAIAAAHQLVASGEVPTKRVEDALDRVFAMKKKFIGKIAPPVLAEAKNIVRCKPHLDLIAGGDILANTFFGAGTKHA